MEENQVTDLGNGSVDNVVQPPAQDKGFTRDQVAKIVNAEKNKAADAVRRELEQKYQADMEQLNASRANTQAQNPVDIDQKIREKLTQHMADERKRQEDERIKSHVQEMAGKFGSKLSQGKTAYDDFDEVTKDFDPGAFPELTYLLAGTDNAEHILYEISKNPLKMAGLDRLAEKSPRQAQAALSEIANSIMANRQAQADSETQQTNAPLDRLQTSKVSGSNGKQSINSLRYESWLKG